MASADLNGDGLLDLVATESQSPNFAVFFGLADGGLGAPTEYFGTDGQALALGDVNGDGLPDVAVSDGPSLQIFLNEGSGTLNPVPLIVFLDATGITEISIADFNHDGLADLVIGYATSPTFQIAFLFGEAGGMFSAPHVIPGIGVETPLFVGDLNQDGLPDIVLNTSDGYHLAVFLNQGDGGFEISYYPIQSGGQLVSLPSDGGAPDLVFGSAKANGVQVLKNSGHGAFSIGPLYPGPGADGGYPGGTGTWLTVGDFNGDCLPDIATDYAPREGCGQSGAEVLVLYGNGDGLRSPGELATAQ